MPRYKLKITRAAKKGNSPDSAVRKEKRKDARVEFNSKVTYQSLGHPFKEVIAKNISAGGMCLLLDRKISLRTILELEFKLPGNSEELINTYAEVIWQSNSHTGIKFISL